MRSKRPDVPPRRGFSRRTQILALIAGLAILGVYAAVPAAAVHDMGAFELEGNATNDPAVAGDDWDQVCHEVTITNDPAPPNQIPNQCVNAGDTAAFGGAKAVAWAAELNRNTTLFTTGGAKDPQNISSWAWKDGAGGLPDKDNLVHAFAARYAVPGGANGTDGCAAGVTCDVLYFGSDRFDNSGDAQQGFWFLQNACDLGPEQNGGSPFVCDDPTPGTDPSDDFHTPGDLLVVSDFSNGGGVSTITIYKWDPTCSGNDLKSGGTCGDENLRRLRTSTAAKCAPALTADDFCGIVNPGPGTITMPWTFTDKSGTPNNGALNGEFFEAGVNLTPLGLGGECFASLLSETRSSTATDATLKDFVLTEFAPCRAEISTVPSATSVSPGVQLRDTALIVGNQPGKFPGVSDGDSHVVNFYLCGPSAAITSCSSTTNSIGSGTLAAVAGTDATSRAQSPFINTAASPLTPGHYCFLATWAGDSNYTDALPRAGEVELNECFDVLQSTTTTVTEPRLASNGTPITAAVPVNTQVVDHALITGAAGFGDPTGSVAFFICNPSQVTGAAGNEVCASGGTPLNTPNATPVANSSPPQTEATSSIVTANVVGVWCFRAVYTPDNANYTGSSDATHGECFTVRDTSSVATVQRWTPQDRVTLTSTGGTNLNGTLVVTLREGSCTGTTIRSTDTFTSPAGGWTSGTIFNTTNTFVVNAANNATPYFWRAVFTSSDPLVDGFIKCEHTDITITD